MACVSNKCCGPIGEPGGCVDAADCCVPGSACNAGTCCIPLDTSGCADSTDCCGFGFPLFSFCDAGTCREPVIKP